MSVSLTDEQIDYLARSASWKFDVSFRDGRNAVDSTVYTGDGMDDLSKLISVLEDSTLPNGSREFRMMCDVGSLFSNWVTATVDDVYALRSRYIAVWGSTDKPPYWDYSAISGGSQTTV